MEKAEVVGEVMQLRDQALQRSAILSIVTASAGWVSSHQSSGGEQPASALSGGGSERAGEEELERLQTSCSETKLRQISNSRRANPGGGTLRFPAFLLGLRKFRFEDLQGRVKVARART